MIVVLIALLVVVIGLAAAAAIGRIPVTTMDEATSTTPFEDLPEGPVDADHIDGLRFDQSLRGYRMNQVDGVLDRVRDELLVRDREIERLRGELEQHARHAAAD
ncbi:DivIVA domain-containing protein [Luteipulveratus mongoliensis]|uniref:DivIVA domain-containing protein n=1 Tax=Luteipulveratus mongoliensis TaxID=571913 RepID=UPI0006964BDC|nr:DivIVA domain-containing protein [Luteipulveratus mongoliensis]